jgi:hypothetical protein
MSLIEGRVCGGCVECCRFIAIDTDGLQKPSNVLCTHCSEGVGCEVYSVRPSVCSGWHCLWRSMPQLSDDWRPDISGIVIRPDDIDRNDVTFTIIDPLKRYLSEGFAQVIGMFAQAGYSVRVQFMGLPGQLPATLDLTSQLKNPVQQRHLNGVLTVLANARDGLSAFSWRSDGLGMRSDLLARSNSVET